jgi:hypothetical protein
MRIIGIALAIAAIVALAGQPAAAQYQATLQFRYWGTGLYFNQPTIPFSATDPGSAWGATVRLDHQTRPWSLSARYDSVSATPTNWVWSGASLWDANVHYRFGSNVNQYAGAFVGYGYWSPRDTTGSPLNQGSTSGLRYGAEFMWRQPSGLYFTGEAAFGGWNASGFGGASSATMSDFRIAAGYEFQGGWGIEGGYRVFSTAVNANPGCPLGCDWRHSGLTAAITFRR